MWKMAHVVPQWQVHVKQVNPHPRPVVRQIILSHPVRNLFTLVLGFWLRGQQQPRMCCVHTRNPGFHATPPRSDVCWEKIKLLFNLTVFQWQMCQHPHYFGWLTDRRWEEDQPNKDVSLNFTQPRFSLADLQMRTSCLWVFYSKSNEWSLKGKVTFVLLKSKTALKS